MPPAPSGARTSYGPSRVPAVMLMLFAKDILPRNEETKVIWLLAPILSATLSAQPAGSDVAAARALFERNLEAIRRRDKAAYLSCYLDSPKLAKTGADGITLGYPAFAKAASENWPDTFEASDLQLVPVDPGIVYGTYRYRVRYAADEQTGVSERLFVKTPKGWKIAMTSAFPAPP